MESHIKIKIIILLITSTLFSACTQNEQGEKNNTEGTNNHALSTASAEDARFAAGAAAMELKQLALSKMGVQNSIRPEIQNTSREFVNIHTRQLYQLRDIASKKRIAIPQEISKKDEERFKKINFEIADDFEKKYFDELTANYKKAVFDFEDALKTKDPEIHLWISKALPELRKNLGISVIYQEKSTARKKLKIK